MNLQLKSLRWMALDRMLMWVWVVPAMWLVILVLGAAAQRVQTSGKAAAAIEHYQHIQSNAVEPSQDVSAQIEGLLRNNLFVPPPSQKEPPQTLAILGDMALIGDRWYREGQEAEGFEIVEIAADYVRVRYDGNEHRLSPFEVQVDYGRASQAGDAPAAARRGRGRGGPAASGPPTGTSPAPTRDVTEQPRPQRGEMMEMRTRLENMTPEQRREAFERFRNASPEERERMREEFRRDREE